MRSGAFPICRARTKNPNGWIRGYEFYVSQDGAQWGKPVAQGEFARNDSRKKVLFDTGEAVYAEEGTRGQYIRLVITSGFGQDPYTTVADFDILID